MLQYCTDLEVVMAQILFIQYLRETHQPDEKCGSEAEVFMLLRGLAPLTASPTLNSDPTSLGTHRRPACRRSSFGDDRPELSE